MNLILGSVVASAVAATVGVIGFGRRDV